MPRAWQWKAGIAFFFTMLAVWFCIPNFVDLPDTKEAREAAPWYLKVFPNSRIKLGLDLQGGIHMVLGIDLDRARLNEADRMARDLKEFSAKEEFKIESVEREYDSSKLKVKLSDPADAEKFEKYLQTRFNILVIAESEASKGVYTLDLDPQRHKEIESQTIAQTLETLRNRLDEFGVAEPSIQAQGKDRIVIQLPGMDDPQRAKNVLGRTAQLEFRIVDEESMSSAALDVMVSEARKTLPKKYKIDELNRAIHDRLPAGTTVLMKEEPDPTNGQVIETAFLVKQSEGLTGDKLEDARIGSGEFNQPTVNLRFNPAGAEILDGITRDNINKKLAIVLDDKIQSDPVIRSRIGDGRPQITFGKP